MRFAAILFIVGCSLNLSTNPARSAELSPAAQKAMTYLVSQQQDNGAYFADGEVTASRFQATAEAEHARLRYELTGNLDARIFLQQNSGIRTEDVARRIIIGRLSDQDVYAMTTSLAAMQNADGGFGERNGYQSTVVDTAFVLEAMATTHSDYATIVTAAISFLIDQQKADGSFGLTSAADSSVYLTALASSALQKYVSAYDVSSHVDAATDYLQAQMHADASWGTDWESAQALIAIIPGVSDDSLFSNAVERLRSQQADNGSWGQSVYATALSLRALYLADHRGSSAPPGAAEFFGHVRDSISGAAIQAARVSVDAHSDIVAYTDNSGEFRLTNVPVGTLTLRYEAAGYSEATQVVQSRSGMVANVGDITLGSLPNTGNILGRVTDAVSGAAIAGATIELSGPSPVGTSTSVNGEYRLASTPGTVILSITANGYNPVSASVDLSAGMNLFFSPALSPEGAPGADELKIVGQVVDANDSSPLVGVQIQDTNGASGVSGSDGKFELLGIRAGNASLTVRLDGYQEMQASMVLPDSGTVNLGVVRLQKVNVEATSKLTGVITDAQSGQPIIGARVEIAGTGLESNSAFDGSYRIEGIVDLAFTMTVAANGYSTEVRNVTLSRHGAIVIDTPLFVSTGKGVAIDSLVSELPSYPAYSQPTLTALFHNAGDVDKTLQLSMTIANAAGHVVDLFPAVHEPIPGEITDSILTVPAAANVLVEFRWKAGALPPGQYHVTLRGQDNETLETIAQREALVTIDSTTSLPKLSVIANPVSTNLDAVENVSFIAEIINRSNTSAQTQISYRWVSPSGAEIKEGVRGFTLEPQDTTKVVELESFSHIFNESGEYKLTVQSIGGAIPDSVIGSSVHVAPKVRIDVSGSVNPENVLPEGNKRIHFKIELKGSEQE